MSSSPVSSQIPSERPYLQASEKRVFRNDVEKVVSLFDFDEPWCYAFICRCLAIRTKKGYVPKKNNVGMPDFNPDIGFYLAQIKQCVELRLAEIYGDDWETDIDA